MDRRRWVPEVGAKAANSRTIHSHKDSGAGATV